MCFFNLRRFVHCCVLVSESDTYFTVTLPKVRQSPVNSVTDSEENWLLLCTTGTRKSKASV
jgi:hypothetical protein